MIHARPGDTIHPYVDGAPTGLTGQVGWRLENMDNEIVVARATDQTVEYATGAYRRAIILPDDLPHGRYVAIADFPDGTEVTAEDLQVNAAGQPLLSGPGVPWAPSPDDLGALMRARTKDDQGVELGAFTATTRPTGDQVQQLIDVAVAELATIIELDADSRHLPAARHAAALKAAVLVEMSYFPEQVAEGQSPHEQLERLAAQALDLLANTTTIARPERGLVSLPMRNPYRDDELPVEDPII